MTTARTYTEADAIRWLEAQIWSTISVRDGKLLDAWMALKAQYPTMTAMDVCGGLAYVHGDATSKIAKITKGSKGTV